MHARARCRPLYHTTKESERGSMRLARALCLTLVARSRLEFRNVGGVRQSARAQVSDSAPLFRSLCSSMFVLTPNPTPKAVSPKAQATTALFRRREPRRAPSIASGDHKRKGCATANATRAPRAQALPTALISPLLKPASGWWAGRLDCRCSSRTAEERNVGRWGCMGLFGRPNNDSVGLDIRRAVGVSVG